MAAVALLVGAPSKPIKRAVRRTVGLGVLLLLLFAYLFASTMLGGGVVTQPRCAAPIVAPGTISGSSLTASQRANAQIIAAEGVKAGVGQQGVVVALATALQESGLQNLSYGDRDSLGLFQQRPSTGWGGPAQILDPVLASDAFFGVATHTTNRGLIDVQGWQSMTVAQAAQAVQASGFPSAYAKWEPMATELAAQMVAGGVQTSATKSVYNLGPVQPGTVMVANLLGPMFGIKTVGGWRPSDTIDPNGHPTGLALDFMTDDIAGGKARGDQLAAYAQAHAGELDVKYIIWQQHIWSPARAAEGWRAMPDRGSPTANHMDHVHLSLNGGGSITAVAGCSGAVASAGAASGWYAGTSGDPSSMQNVAIVGTWSDTDAEVQTMLSSLDYLNGWTGAIDIAVGGTVLGSAESFRAAASGAYDTRWRAAAQTLESRRAGATGPTFVRPWHEFNGGWYTGWNVTSASLADYQAAWRRWVSITKSVMPNAFVVWSPNDGSHLDVHAAAAYPGNDVVDIIGVDSYDFTSPGLGVAGINAYMSRGGISRPEGVEDWRKFAELHGKPLALPEWGLCPASRGCGGDHPEYITAMHNWMEAHANTAAWASGAPIPASSAGRVLYTIYFDRTHEGDAGFTLAANPRSRAVFTSLAWGN